MKFKFNLKKFAFGLALILSLVTFVSFIATLASVVPFNVVVVGAQQFASADVDTVARSTTYKIDFEFYGPYYGGPPPRQVDPVNAVVGEVVPKLNRHPNQNSSYSIGAFLGYLSEKGGAGKLYYGSKQWYPSNTISYGDDFPDLIAPLALFDRQEDTTLYSFYNGKGTSAPLYVVLNPNFGEHVDQTFNSNILEVKLNQTSPKPKAVPTRGSYKFGGYYSQPDGTGTKFYDSDLNPTFLFESTNQVPKIMHARWMLANNKVTLNPNGGSGGTQSVTVDDGNQMPQATAPTRPGFLFLGYFDTKESSGGKKYYNADMTSAAEYNVGDDIVLYASGSLSTIQLY